ncbi:DNA polymerase I [Tichowtungia aerotolerans]|uniref:DNA polymerase I n=1 Tax=Tichowtungia aerotolerans TaxID=2697043 RepID=A0A6P1M6J5_9BACT|nr:DNA polymerase I [Tichowtungia aerotolerans]QHI69477.1 DNA polymerase I [Tichowtungia aerotolerans]
MAKKLFLLDGMALVYRSYFAFMRNPMINSKGRNVSAVFGFLNALLEIIEKHEPTHIAVAFDVSGPTFRHDEYPEYKAQREETPEEIRAAVPAIREFLEAFNIPVLTKQGYEADDIIGTLARRAEQEGFDTTMVTPDKDYAQLVDDHTFMMKPAKKGADPEVLGVEQVLEQWGIEKVDQVIDILGMAGDTADNIPGIPGIGPKTAQKLIAQYGSLENLLEHTDELKGKQKEKVEENKERARLCKRLVTIHTNVPIDETPDSLVRNELDEEKLTALFAEFEFTAFSKRLFGKTPPPAPGAGYAAPADTGGQGDLFAFAAANTPAAPAKEEPVYKTIDDVKHRYHLVSTAEDRAALAKKMGEASSFCFDTETTGLDPRMDRLIGMSFAIQPHEAWYVTLPPDDEETRKALEPFKAVFGNEEIEKTGHNLKFDIAMLREAGVEVKGPLFDTMLAHYLLDPDQRHGLDRLAGSFLQYAPVSITTLIGEKKKEQLHMTDVPLDKLSDYACEDADVTLQLRYVLEPLLEKQHLRKSLDTIECPLIPVLVEMEANGIALDTAALEEISGRLAGEIENCEKHIYELAGHEFNLNSPKQLGEVLFDEMNLVEKPKKTKTGQYKTNEEELQKLAGDHEIVSTILDYRAATKLKSTYVDALPGFICEKTGRIHTSFNQAVTTTGRLASSDPNIQNIPVRTEQGQEIRRAFVAASNDFTLLAADYSQIELRIMAHLSGDEHMKQAFIDGADIHTATAARVFGVAPEEVTKEQRRRSKMVNFGIIYGISAFGLSQRLRIPRKEAAEIIENYFAQYPAVKQFMDSLIDGARDKGYVETITGRRRHIRDINSNNGTVRSAAERYAINAPIQGSAADLIKIAMIRIEKMLRGKRSKLLLQVHDELVFDLHNDEQDLIPEIQKLMQEALPLSVPLIVDCGTGDNWLQAH